MPLHKPTLDNSFWIGTQLVQPVLNRVTDGDNVSSVEPRVMAVLVYLAHRAGKVVSRDELIATVWTDLVVNEDALTRAISEARKLFGDDSRAPSVIETIRGRGYRLIAPVRFDTASTSNQLESGDGVASVASPNTELVLNPRERARYGVALATVVLSLTAVGAWLALTPEAAPAPRFAEAIPLTSYSGKEVEPAMSPDGTRVAFAWDSENGAGYDIYVKQTGREEPFRLTDDAAPEGSPAWSPDGATVAFVRYGEEAGIYAVSSLGGESRLIYATPPPLRVHTLDWSPDGNSLVFAQRTGDQPAELWLLDLATRDARALTETGPELRQNLNPRFSPDGHQLAFVRSRRAGGPELYLLSLESGEERRLVDNLLGVVGLDWLDSEALVVSSFRSGTYGLWRIAVATGAQEWIPTTGQRSYSPSVASQTGAVVYEKFEYEKNVWRIQLDSPGGEVLGTEPVITSTWYDCEAWLAPDGKRLAFTSARSGNLELWLSGADGENPFQLTHFDGTFVGNPRWSPDGSRLAFYASPSGTAAVYLADVRGGNPTRLTPADWNARVTGWTSDGEAAYFTSDHSGSWQLWRVEATGGEPVRVTVDGALSAAESSNGQYLYFTYPDRAGLWRSALSEGRMTGAVEDVLETLPVADAGNWVLHDTGVYYLTRQNGTVNVAFLDLATGQSRTVAEVTRIADPSLSVSQDGTTLLYGRIERSESDLYHLEPGGLGD